MGIDARIETERAEPLAEIPDPRGHFSWGLSLQDDHTTTCLRFIDPYGNTVFNEIQLPVLLSELEAARSSRDDRRLQAAKEQYLKRAASWPQAGTRDAQAYTTSLSVTDIRHHLDQVISLVRDALSRGPHHYVRFVGD